MNRRHFRGLVVSTATCVLSYSAFVPAQVLALDELGHSALVNGAITALFFVVVLVASPFVHHLVRLVGHERLYWAAKALFALGPLLVFVGHSTAVWVACSVVMGLGAALVWPLTETCIAELAPPEGKGAFTGSYQTALGLAFAMGPFVTAAFATRVNALALACFLLSSVPTLAVRGFPWASLAPAADFTEAPASVEGPLRRLMSTLVLCAFLGGFYESGFNGVTVLIGRAVGLGEGWALAVPGVIGVGSLLAQYPAGLVADRWGEARALVGSFRALVVATASVPLVFLAPGAVWPLALVWGAAGGAIYTLSVVAVSRQVRASFIAQFTGYLVAGYTVGCAVAPTIAGASFDVSPTWGISLAFVPVMLLASRGLGLLATPSPAPQ